MRILKPGDPCPCCGDPLPRKGVPQNTLLLLSRMAERTADEDDGAPTIDPIWCEDCDHFCNADMGGEGECDVDNTDTWYGRPAARCPNFSKKEVADNGQA